ncbi:hypothetical protein ACFQ0B_52290 [Nonomuraea thailandensis]
MNLQVGGTLRLGGLDQVAGDLSAAALDGGGDRQQRLELPRDLRAGGVGADPVDQFHAAGELGGGERGVRGRAEAALVQP